VCVCVCMCVSIPFKVVLIASAPGEADLPDVACPVEAALVRPPPLQYHNGTQHTVIRETLGEEGEGMGREREEDERGRSHEGEGECVLCYHLLHPRGSSYSSQQLHTDEGKCLRNSLSPPAKQSVPFQHRTDYGGTEGGRNKS